MTILSLVAHSTTRKDEKGEWVTFFFFFTMASLSGPGKLYLPNINTFLHIPKLELLGTKAPL